MTIGEFLRARVPALAWLPAYDRSWLRADAVAGVTTASVIIPKAMAYATLAGLAVQVGLYTALLPMAVYAVLGSSLRLSVSTTTTIGILTAAEISHIAPGAPADQAARSRRTRACSSGVILVARRSAPARLRRAVHLRAGADRVQGRHRPRHRRRPGAEAVRPARAEGPVAADGRGAGAGACRHFVTAHARACRLVDDRADAAARPVRAARARAAARRGARHRRIGAAGPEGGRGGHDRRDSRRPAGCHAP